MKAIQLRFSCWYNRRAGGKGTLWEGRYISVIVQSSDHASCTVSAKASAVEEEERALRTMAAYFYYVNFPVAQASSLCGQWASSPLNPQHHKVELH